MHKIRTLGLTQRTAKKPNESKNSLTESNPHPVGMNARIQTIMSTNVMSSTAIKVINTATNERNMRPLINRNTI